VVTLRQQGERLAPVWKRTTPHDAGVQPISQPVRSPTNLRDLCGVARRSPPSASLSRDAHTAVRCLTVPELDHVRVTASVWLPCCCGCRRCPTAITDAA
jgi:hypothetical protein